MTPAKVSGSVWFLALSVFVFTASGYVDTMDADPSITTAQMIVHQGRLWSEGQKEAMLYVKGKDQHHYSKLGFGMPVLYVIPVLLGGDDTRHIKFWVSMVNPVLSATIAWVLFLFALQLTNSVSKSGLVTLAIVFGTLLFPYSKTSHREIFQALTLLLAFYFSYNQRFFLAGIAIAVGILTKQAFLVPALPLLVWFVIRRRYSCLVPVFMSVAIWGLFSVYCLGGITQTGYNATNATHVNEFWSTPLWKGLHLQLSSYRTGIWVYSPVVLLVLALALHKFRHRELTSFEWLALASIGIQAAFYARWFDPMGGQALGPRYLVSVLPLMVLFCQGTRTWNFLHRFRYVCAGVLMVSLLLQSVFVSIKNQQFWTLETQARAPLLVPHWLGQLRLFSEKWKNPGERYEVSKFGGPQKVVDISQFKTLHGYNFWWLHLWRLKTKSDHIAGRARKDGTTLKTRLLALSGAHRSELLRGNEK